MTAALSPIVSEFASEEQAVRHGTWFRAKVRASLDDARPPVTHDEFMAEVETVIAERIEVVSVLLSRQAYP